MWDNQPLINLLSEGHWRQSDSSGNKLRANNCWRSNLRYIDPLVPNPGSQSPCHLQSLFFCNSIGIKKRNLNSTNSQLSTIVNLFVSAGTTIQSFFYGELGITTLVTAPTCFHACCPPVRSYCQKDDHLVETCYKLHLELRPKDHGPGRFPLSHDIVLAAV